jgi:hypothetical protein
LLDNINVDNGIHNYKWQLQCAPETTVTVDAADRATVHGHTARLDCTFSSPLAADFPTAPHTFTLHADEHFAADLQGGSPAYTVAHPRLIGELDGPNCNLLAVISQRRIDEEPLVVRVEPVSRVFQVFVEHGDWIDQVLYAPDHGRLRLPGVHITSEVAVIRRDRRGRVHSLWSRDGAVQEPV